MSLSETQPKCLHKKLGKYPRCDILDPQFNCTPVNYRITSFSLYLCLKLIKEGEMKAKIAIKFTTNI